MTGDPVDAVCLFVLKKRVKTIKVIGKIDKMLYAFYRIGWDGGTSSGKMILYRWWGLWIMIGFV